MNFIVNEYLNEYVKIIHNARRNIQEGYGEIHHIIPRSLGIINGLKNIITINMMDGMQ